MVPTLYFILSFMMNACTCKCGGDIASLYSSYRCSCSEQSPYFFFVTAIISFNPFTDGINLIEISVWADDLKLTSRSTLGLVIKASTTL